ncbi:hypothetical protein [Staphylococcus sp. EZ-P03]|uniref:hypothetical protein n=1 Tax=Staphylococcus sp. EZ-P03 TaxID=2282739 RepID=UPI000DF7653E|nr:hypothetical protein [Staphylococcus sp. EZ-P03]
MLDIKEIKEKYKNEDATVLKQQFKQLLSTQWDNIQQYFKKQDVDNSLKFRILYLYDKITSIIEVNFEKFNKSFFILYNKRLNRANDLHFDEYQKCLNLLNLLSDIEHYLENIDDIKLKSYYHREKGR